MNESYNPLNSNPVRRESLASMLNGARPQIEEISKDFGKVVVNGKLSRSGLVKEYCDDWIARSPSVNPLELDLDLNSGYKLEQDRRSGLIRLQKKKKVFLFDEILTGVNGGIYTCSYVPNIINGEANDLGDRLETLMSAFGEEFEQHVFFTNIHKRQNHMLKTRLIKAGKRKGNSNLKSVGFVNLGLYANNLRTYAVINGLPERFLD